QVDRYAAAVHKAMQDKEVVKQFKANHLDPVVSTPAQTRESIAAYRKQWEPVIRNSGYRP
ncbi:hypothetical protein, partial [Raoultella sp. 18099]